MSVKSYAEKLKDPRWQKKRLEILSRDDFMCQKCQDKESTLHVHHRYYESGVEPWDYEDHTLVTLCWDCHESEQKDYKEYGKILVDTLKRKGFWGYNLAVLASAFDELPVNLPTEVISCIIEHAFRTKSITDRLSEEFLASLVTKK